MVMIREVSCIPKDLRAKVEQARKRLSAEELNWNMLAETDLRGSIMVCITESLQEITAIFAQEFRQSVQVSKAGKSLEYSFSIPVNHQ